MLTLETFKTEFAPVHSPAGVPPSYHNSVVFPGHGDMCDVYFDSIDGEVTQKQIDCYNQFLSSCKRHLEQVDRYILDNLSSSETKRVDNIRNAVLRMDVIDIKYDNPKYDFLVLYGKSYNGFNLITGTPDEMWYYSNYRAGIEKLDSGFYGISNHLLETPWPKVQRGKEKFKPILSQPTINPDHLFEALYDDQRAPDDKLPNTGLSLEREQALSSMFIKTENYGSRCSTVILIDRKNQVFFSERVYDLKTFQFTTQSYQFATVG